MNELTFLQNYSYKILLVQNFNSTTNQLSITQVNWISCMHACIISSLTEFGNDLVHALKPRNNVDMMLDFKKMRICFAWLLKDILITSNPKDKDNIKYQN